MSKNYKWDNPGEWLREKIRNTENINYVKLICYELLDGIDFDTIQDKFQSEMDQDGYFDEITE